MKYVKSLLKTHRMLLLWILVAVAVIAAAWFGKGTEYENIFFAVLPVGVILIALFERNTSTKGDR